MEEQREELVESDHIESVSSVKRYPQTLLQCLGVIGVYLLVSIVIDTGLYILAFIPSLKPIVSYYALQELLICGTTILVLVRMKKSREGVNYKKPSFGKVNLWMIPLLIVFIIGFQGGIIDPIQSVLPEFPNFRKFIDELMKELTKEPISFALSAILIAPIIEEYIYREVILNGLLTNYSPVKAILISSFIFAIMHMNPWQFATAMLMGIVLGWIYVRTRNYYLCILLHAINNGLAFLAIYLFGEDYTSPSYLIPVMVVVALVSLYAFYKLLPRWQEDKTLEVQNLP